MHINKFLKNNLFKRSLNTYSLLKFSNRLFCLSVDDINMPIIDIDKFLNKGQNWERECKNAADSLHETGIMIVKDSVK